MTKATRGNILITAVQVPFTRGGAEVLVDGLRRELAARDFCVDIVQLPFVAQPKDALLGQLALWRALELKVFNGRHVDLVIGTKFPSYMVEHHNKVLWLVHQHRQMYDLYGSRFGDFGATITDETLRRMIVEADVQALRECRHVFTISENVRQRLERYLGVEAQALPPPLPLGDAYRCEAPEKYILSVGRICSIKRVDMLIKALPRVHHEYKVKIVGLPDEPAIDIYLRSEIDKHHLWNRVEFLGRVDDAALIDLYARAFAVYYSPYDEDYGFVTLEGLASGKPIITATDSGGVLEFVRDGENGIVVEPTEAGIGEGINRLVDDTELYATLSKSAAESFATMNWDEVCEQLTATINEDFSPQSLAATA